MANHRLTFESLSVSDLAASVHFHKGLVGIALKEADHDADLRDPYHPPMNRVFVYAEKQVKMIQALDRKPSHTDPMKGKGKIEQRFSH